MKGPKKKIGEILMDAGLIDDLQLKSSLSYQRQWGGRLGSIMIRRGFVSERQLASVMAEQCGMTCVSLDSVERPAEQVLNIVKPDIAKKFGIFPIGLEGKTLAVAVSDPTDLKTLDEISFTVGLRIKPVLAVESDIQRAIETNYDGKFERGEFIIEKQEPPPKRSPALSSSSGTSIIREDDERVLHQEIKDLSSGKLVSAVSQKAVIESVIDLLVAKGVFSKEELMRQIRSKGQQ